MANLYAHKSGLGYIEPVALPGHNVVILYGQEEHYRKVLWFESIPPFQAIDLGAIVAGATNPAATQATNLAVFDNEFGQFRWFPIDHLQVNLWLPSADGKYRLKNLMAPVDEMIVNRDPCLHLTEFFVWEDNAPFFLGVNYTRTNLTQGRIVAEGFRFKLTDKELPDDTIRAIKDGTVPATFVMASGRA